MDKKKKIIIGIIMSVMVIIIAIFGIRRQASRCMNVTKIGIILPMSGNFAPYGVDCRDGIRFAIDELGNNQFELYFEDSKGEAKTAVAAYHKLINISDVNFVIGDMFSNTTLAIAPIANKDKCLLISPTASSKNISKSGIYSLSVFPDETFESEMVADFINKTYKNTGILFEKVAAAEAMNEAFSNKLLIPIRIRESFDPNTVDFRSIVLKIKDANIDSLYLVTYTNNAIKIIEQFRELNISTAIIGQSALFDPNILPALKNTDFQFFLTGPFLNPEAPTQKTLSIVTKFKEKYGKDINQMSTQGYIATVVALDFYKQIQKGSYSKKFIENYHSTILGIPFSFSKNLTSQSGLTIYKVANNKFIRIEKDK